MAGHISVILILQVKPTIAYLRWVVNPRRAFTCPAERDDHFILMCLDHGNMICHDRPWPLQDYQYYITCVTKCPCSHYLPLWLDIFWIFYWLSFIINSFASIGNQKKKKIKGEEGGECSLRGWYWGLYSIPGYGDCWALNCCFFLLAAW